MTDSELGMLEYYKDGVKLASAPVEVGTYEARVAVDHDNVIYLLKRTLTITPGKPSVVFSID